MDQPGITDHFLHLGFERRPWLAPDEVNQRFLELSGGCHPDRFTTASEADAQSAHDRFIALNTARQCLGETKSRLLHLLELETGTKPSDIQRLPPGSMEIFMKVGQACREADAFIASQAKITSPMLKVAAMTEALRRMQHLRALEAEVNGRQEALLAELRGMNDAWASSSSLPPGDARVASLPLGRIEEIYRALGYLGRWLTQVRERTLQLIPN